MTIYGIYPADGPGALPVPREGARGQMFVQVDTDQGESKAVEIAIKSGSIAPGELHAVDLTDAPKFLVEVESSVTVIEE